MLFDFQNVSTCRLTFIFKQHTMNTFKLSFFPRNTSLTRMITTRETDPEVVSSAIQSMITETFFEFEMIKGWMDESDNYDDRASHLGQLYQLEESTIEVLDFEIFVGDFISIDYETLNGFKVKPLNCI